MNRRAAAIVTALLALALLSTTATTAAAALPTIDYTLAGPLGDDGWYVGPVTIAWSVGGATDSNCPTVETLRDDTIGVRRTCTASNADASITAQTKVIKIDQTPPVAVAGAAARGPDHPPFYVAPVAIAFSGTDATSGLGTCTALTYAGPDAPSAVVSGTCRDRAGNTSAPAPFSLTYDTTAPILVDVTATLAADRRPTVTWATPSPDAQTVTVTRRPGDATLLDRAPATVRTVTDAPLAPGATNTYTITLTDAAGNATTATVTATAPPATTAANASGSATKTALPTLRWRTQHGAKYYNFQLYRNGRKLLTAWPTRPHYTLRASWRLAGKTYKLTAGRYRWYVWPGYGPRSRHRYGRLHAKGAVTYPAPPMRDGGQ
ncbi:hypothetical protein [Baekduia sp. Peel2402]|uniref:hypothetical protein n=1 Tax=Baekduia sp. Peel2402 TaxID=3458296 RepID=UPI00403E583F